MVVGLALGVVAGTWVREEYHFPTSERLRTALKIFEKPQYDISLIVKRAEEKVLQEHQSNN